MESCVGQAFADKEWVELITTAARDLHLTETAANSPTETPLVRIDAFLNSFQFRFEDTAVKAAHFQEDIYTRGSSYIH